MREQRAELPAPHLSPEKVIDQREQQAEQQLAQVQARKAAEPSRLDRLIAAAWELANEVKDKAVEVAQNASDRVEQLRDRFERWRGQRTENAEQRLDTQPRSPVQEPEAARGAAAWAPELGVDAQIESGRQALPGTL